MNASRLSAPILSSAITYISTLWVFLMIAGPIQAAEGTSPIESIRKDLAGKWIGTLTYRDFQSDQMVTLPATVTIESSSLAPVMVRRFEFADPGRVVVSSEIVTIDEANQRVASRSIEGGAGPETFSILDVAWTDADNWSLTLERPGVDGANAARIREQHTMSDGLLRAEVRVLPNDAEPDEWFTRNELELERVEADANDLAGNWAVDLRPLPKSDPYIQPMMLDVDANGTLTGTFYNTPIENARLNDDWGAVRFAFTTADNSGVYHTAGVLDSETITGTTLALGRGFFSVWSAKRQ